MRATRVYTFLVGIGAMSLGGCVNPHLSDRFGIPERNLFELQTRRAAAGTVLALTGEDAERIMKRYDEIMCKEIPVAGGGAARRPPGSHARGGLVMR